MERLTAKNDNELKDILDYLMENMHAHEARRIYDEMEELKNQMCDGFCHFTFTKVSGEEREAYGTRASDIIEKYSSFNKRRSNRQTCFNSAFSYFDIEKKDWRCFRIDSLIGMDRDYVI